MLGSINIERVKERNRTDIITGAAMRNQFYYDAMTRPGVRPKGTNWLKAPEYIQAAANAAFTYGEKGTPEDEIPEAHIEAYVDGEVNYDDADLQAIMDLIVAKEAHTVA
jgi:hypothetical protein